MDERKNDGVVKAGDAKLTKATSVNYDNLGEVFTFIESGVAAPGAGHDANETSALSVRSEVYSVADGVSGWAVKTVLGYTLGGDTVQDDTGKPEVVNYADKICMRDKTWNIAKTHEAQTVRAFVKSVGQDTGGKPNVAAYPLNNEVSVDLTIPAKTSYTVTFDKNGGENAPAKQVKWHNETLILSSQQPTRAGHTFMGWKKGSQADGDYSVDYAAGATFKENANTALVAVWKPLQFAVKYDANGGVGAPDDQFKTYGKGVKLSDKQPTRQGYTFKGWSTSKMGTTVAYTPGADYTADTDVTLYAVWVIITYNITYNANGGNGAPGSQTKSYGEPVVLSSTVPTKDGHEFSGWSETDVDTVSYRPGDKYTDNANLSLKAVWGIDSYTVSYDSNGGTGAPEDQQKTFGTPLNLSGVKPTRHGYDFTGWSTNQNGSVEYQPNQKYEADADLTLYAIWKIKTYTVTYDANGGTGAPSAQSKEYGKSVNILEGKPEKEEAEFLGWSTTSSGAVEYTGGSIYNANENLSLYAVWRGVKLMKTLNGYEICDDSARKLSFGVTTAGTGAAYTAEVKAITELTAGVSFMVVPHVTCTTLSPTLNVNEFGAKPVKQRLSSGSSNAVALVSNDMLAQGKPVRLVYDGASWVVETAVPDVAYARGIIKTDNLPVVPVAKGGTGAATSFQALKNLGITWGTSEAPAKGTPNTIYIQIN